MARSIHQSDLGFKQSNIILNIIYQKLVRLLTKNLAIKNYS